MSRSTLAPDASAAAAEKLIRLSAGRRTGNDTLGTASITFDTPVGHTIPRHGCPDGETFFRTDRTRSSGRRVILTDCLGRIGRNGVRSPQCAQVGRAGPPCSGSARPTRCRCQRPVPP
ncbi:hypothetical protein KNE206_18920 [Kitasatospora sp. NE20-6]